MLSPATTLKAALLALSPTTDKTQGITDLVAAIANYMNQVQGGSLGTPGIFALDEASMVSMLSSLEPVTDDSWVDTFGDAFQSGSEGAMIAPATVTNPVWLGSGGKDVATASTGSAAIPTISTAKANLVSQLSAAKADASAPLAFATAFHDATLDFTFSCVGLGAPPGLPPITVPTPAQ